MNDYVLEILRSIYAHKRFIILVVALAFIVSVGRELIAGLGYEAETTLVITSAPTTTEQGLIMPETINPKVYQTMATSSDVLGEVLTSLEENNAFDGPPPDLRDFRALLNTSLETIDPTARPMTYSPMLTIGAIAETPELATEIVDTWAEVLTEAARRANQVRISGISEAMSERTEEHKSELDKVWMELAEETAEYDLKLLREELDKRQTLIQTLDQKLVDAEVDLRAAEERLVAVREQLEVEPEIKELFRSPSETAYWIAESTADSDAALEELEQKGMRSEEINPAYTELRRNLASAQQDVASYAARKESLAEQLTMVEKKQQATQQLLADQELIQTRLNTEEEHMRESYREMAILRTYMESAGLIVSGRAEETIHPVGLNRLSDQIYASADPGFLGRKGRVLIATFVAAMLALAVAAYPVVGQPIVEQVLATEKKNTPGKTSDNTKE